MNKEKYEVPVIDIIVFHSEDIIVTSGDLDQGQVDPFENMINLIE